MAILHVIRYYNAPYEVQDLYSGKNVEFPLLWNGSVYWGNVAWSLRQCSGFWPTAIQGALKACDEQDQEHAHYRKQIAHH